MLEKEMVNKLANKRLNYTNINVWNWKTIIYYHNYWPAMSVITSLIAQQKKRYYIASYRTSIIIYATSKKDIYMQLISHIKMLNNCVCTYTF